MVGDWLTRQPWYNGPPDPELTKVAAYRFDDPANEVGIETLLVQADKDGPVWQVPVLYSADPRPTAEEIAVIEHSELGQRHVSAAAGDPLYLAALTRAIVEGTGQADLFAPDGSSLPLTMDVVVQRPAELRPDALPADWPAGSPAVRTDATTTVIDAEPVRQTVQHRLDRQHHVSAANPNSGALRGHWPNGADDVVLVTLLASTPRRPEMPTGLPPNDVLDLLRQPNPAVMATVRQDGQPVSVATWYLIEDDGRLLLNLDASRTRLKHLRNDGRVALTAIKADDWYTHVSVQGQVVEISDDTDLVDIDRLSRHYGGNPYPVRDQPRVSVWVQIDRWSGWGAAQS